MIILFIQSVLATFDCALPKNDITLPSSHSHFKQEQPNLDFHFYWDFSDDNSTVTMAIRINKISFFGFGIGTSMTNSDMWIFEIQEDNKLIIVKDSWSDTRGYPRPDLQRGGQDDVTIIGCHYDDDISWSTVKFIRKAETGDKYDLPLIQKESFDIFVAWDKPEKKTITHHSESPSIFSIKFLQGFDSDAKAKTNSVYDWHRFTNMVGWGILADIGIIVARYYKTFKYRMELHAFIMSILTLSSFVTMYLMLENHLEVFDWSQQSGKPLRRQFHFWVGFPVMVIIFFQCIGGIILRLKILSPKLTDSWVSRKPQIHSIIGHVLYVLGKINIGIGIYLNPIQFYENLLWISYFLIFFWRVLFEFFYIKANLVKYIVGSPSQSQVQSSEYQALINNIETKETEQGSKLWCIFNNYIVDLTNEVHPGGQYIWHAVKGREISRFIYGAYGLEATNIKPHSHSQYAIAMLKKNIIGELLQIPFYQNKQNSSSSLINFNIEENLWSLETVQQITPLISYFGFQNTNYSFRTQLDSVESFGRYFLIEASDKNIPIRPYTMVLCMAKPNQEYRKKLLIHVNNLLRGEKDTQIPQLQKNCDELPLIIKRYNSNNGFSQYIHQDSARGLYNIKGPYGVSFGLPQQGNAVIICGGTGLFPFLDLLDYFLKYTINLAIQQQLGDDVAESINQDNIKFRPLNIIMFAAIASESDLVGSDIYLSIQKLQSYLSKPNFNLILRTSVQIPGIKTTNKRFGPELFREEIKNVYSIQRYLICGPPAMNREVPLILQEMGVPQGSIHLV